MSASHPTPKTHQIAAAVIGNALEWYDFIIFGFSTVIISQLFFPTHSEYASLLLATGTFGAGFFMRPVGGILLGIYADKHGRKAALQLIISLMTLAIAMIAFAPTYAAIGVAAPVIIVIARLLQGFSAGGEFASATAFLIESAPTESRGFYGSWQMFGQGLATLTGALIGALLTYSLAPSAFESWGWRIPFLFGLIIGPVGLYIRRHLEETEAFLEARQAPKERPGVFVALVTHLRQVLACMGIVTATTISFYVILLYMPTFASTQLQLPMSAAFIAQSIGLTCFMILVPVSGALSDRFGRKPIIIGTLFLILGLAHPLFSWVHESPSLGNLITMQIILCSLLGAFAGPLSTALAEQFPVHVRSTLLAIAYNVAVLAFGGFALFFVTWLIQATGSPIAPVFYVMFGAIVGIVAAFFLVEHAGKALPSPDDTGRDL